MRDAKEIHAKKKIAAQNPGIEKRAKLDGLRGEKKQTVAAQNLRFLLRHTRRTMRKWDDSWSFYYASYPSVACEIRLRSQAYPSDNLLPEELLYCSVSERFID